MKFAVLNILCNYIIKHKQISFWMLSCAGDETTSFIDEC